MASHFLYGVIRLASALGIFSVVCGCVGTPVEQEVFMGEGFQSSLPNAEARVLVWGNHSGAMTRTLGWLHDHQISAVDPSWVEKELTDPIFDRRTRMEQKRQVLAAAKSVGASLVLFTQVEDSQMGWKFDVMSFGHKRMKFIGVEIRGMNAETGDVVFGAKAWNSEPLAVSERLVMDLTTFALKKAFKESQPSLSAHQNVHQAEMPSEYVPAPSAPGDVIPASQLVEDQPTILPEQPTELVDAAVEEKTVLNVTSMESSVDERTPEAVLQPYVGSSTDDSSLGLKVASGALSLLYTPIKVTYAVVGGFFGSFAYILTAGNDPVAQSIWDASLQGDYWLTAKHLQGEEVIHFRGEPSPIDVVQQARIHEAAVEESEYEIQGR